MIDAMIWSCPKCHAINGVPSVKCRMCGGDYMATKIQTLKIDVTIHELHDVDIPEILAFIRTRKWIHDAQIVEDMKDYNHDVDVKLENTKK